MINWGTIIFDNTIYQWVAGLITGVIILLILSLLKWLLRRRTRKSPGKASILLSALVDHTPWIFIFWLAIFAFLRFLNLTAPAVSVVETITIIVILIQIGLWAVEIIQYWLIRRQIALTGKEGEKKGSVAAIVIFAKIVIWTLVIILVLENIPGIHVTTLIASLGIGGIAIGLALQKILGDLFASLTISIDQPFVEGDAISVDEFSGQVEHIGLKSTRVRSDTGEELIFSNSDLLNSRIRNFKSMNHRLVVFTINVSHDTPFKKLQKIPKILKDIIEAQPKVTFKRSHLKQIDGSNLLYEVVYTINAADFDLYMDTQQKVNLEILRQFDDQDILMA